MNWLVQHVVSGQSFFTGIALIIIAALASTATRPMYKRVCALSFLVGVIAVAISSTPIPYWLYAVACGATLGWIASAFKEAWRPWGAYATIAVWLIAAIVEVPYLFPPSIHSAPDRRITIIGDSLTAGVGGNTETWPTLLAREHHVEVQDISHMGDDTAAALKRAKTTTIESSLLLVEIGGNDILGATTAETFERDLDALLVYLSAPDRQIVMFELPLPPFYHEYGRAQRSSAARHNVRLIPKWAILSIVAGDHSTLDSVHLTQSGHQAMADLVWRLLEPAFER